MPWLLSAPRPQHEGELDYKLGVGVGQQHLLPHSLSVSLQLLRPHLEATLEGDWDPQPEFPDKIQEPPTGTSYNGPLPQRPPTVATVLYFFLEGISEKRRYEGG